MHSRILNNYRKHDYTPLDRLPIKFNFFTPEIVRYTTEANIALSKLNGFITSLPNIDILLNNLSIQESQSSSAIENIVTTNDKIYRSLALDGRKSPEIKEVLTYRKALWSGYDYIKTNPLDRNAFVQITKTIKNNDDGIRDGLGSTHLTDGAGRVIYTPPQEKKEIDVLLQNLEDYIEQNDDLDSLVKMGIIHYQYESIHPFKDGNGRSGRIINILYLLKQNKLEHPALYLSRYIFNSRQEYYRGFEKVRQQQDWNAWTIYMLNGIRETANYTYQQVRDIHELQLATQKLIHTLPLKNIDVENFTKTLYTQPYSRVKNFVSDKIKSKNTVMRYLDILVKTRTLEKETTKYGFIYKNVPLSCALRQTEMNRSLFDLLNQYGYKKFKN